MISEALLEKARLHVRRWFAARMPKHMLFHDLEHTLSVTRTAVGLGRSMRLPADQLALLEMAALFHDTGYALKYKGHEAEGAKLAEEFLKKNGVSRKDIATVKALIMVTVLDARPTTRSQRIIRDADSAKAGQADFDDKSELLRRELGTERGKRPAGKDWLLENIAYLQDHRFHTEQGKMRYEKQKRINLQNLKEKSKDPVAAKVKPKSRQDKFFERDLSWLSFNDRVLQEAEDPRVPLLERLKFLAIYSSNLDEFYRVRVASLRGLTQLNKDYRTALAVSPTKLLEKINKKAFEQQQRFGVIFRETLLPALEQNGIRIIQAVRLSAEQRRTVREYFKTRILPLLNTAAARSGNAPFIEDRKLYFACEIQSRAKGKKGAKKQTVLLNIPSAELGRFVVLPAQPGNTDLMFLDDVVRMGLPMLFQGHKITGCHAIKLSRDAELYLDEEFTGNVKEKVKKSLKKRHTGVPSRFLYDSAMPKSTLRELRQILGLTKQDVVAGGRYHNFSDLMQLPISGHKELREKDWPALQHSELPESADMFKVIRSKDILLHYPYHDFSIFIRWLRQAASDPNTKHIWITLYRVAEGSAVCAALVDALHNGKDVTVFVEVQARFDEGSNLFWGEALEAAGARVLYSFENVKVHCKLCMVERREQGHNARYSYLSTGNFNERSSRIYSDTALFTHDQIIGKEVSEIFSYLLDRTQRPVIDRLLMAPLTLRTRIEERIDREIMHAMIGKKASIMIKLNSLEDKAMIQKLYDASRAGVEVKLIIRGICCLIPGVPGMSENISVISIVDRFLEHSRIFVFYDDGLQRIHISSADLMGRNLDRRVEAAFPIDDPTLKKEILKILDLQWNDRVKARHVDERQKNIYVQAEKGERPIRSQEATYELLRSPLGTVKKGVKRSSDPKGSRNLA